MKTILMPAAALAITLSAATLSVGAAPEPVPSRPVDSPTAESQWPQWRGPGGLGVIENAGVPLEWSETKNVLWKTAIEGRGHSSPVVWGKRIFLTTAIEGEPIRGAEAPIHYSGGEEFLHPDSLGADRSHTLKVIALDADSGAIVWSRIAYEGRVYDNRHKAGSYASPTAVTDGERVYTYFGSQGVYAWDMEGERVWDRDIGQIKSVGVGVGTSPVLYRDLLILLADEDEGEESFIIALHRETGEEVWKKARPTQATWMTPLIVEDSGGQAQLLTSGVEVLISYDPETGDEIWRAPGLGSNAVHHPLVYGDMAYFTSGYPLKVTAAIPLSSRGEVEKASWMYAKGTGYVPSNVLYEGRIYLTNDGGVLTCLDAESGEVIYEGGRVPLGGTHMASLLAVDGKILMINRDGDAAFIRAGPKHEVLASNTLDEGIYATPAIVKGRIYIRGLRHLYAIGRIP